MAFEYNIEFEVPKDYSFDAVIKKLSTSSMGASWQLELTGNGFYFCDHDKSAESSVALRRVVDEALSHSHSVKIEEI